MMRIVQVRPKRGMLRASKIMSQNGKGSRRRQSSISQKEWNDIFKNLGLKILDSALDDLEAQGLVVKTENGRYKMNSSPPLIKV